MAATLGLAASYAAPEGVHLLYSEVRGLVPLDEAELLALPWPLALPLR